LRFPIALYLHVPFCATRCHYCDFNTYAGLETLFEPYVTALCQEIRSAGAARGRPAASTIFIGGGTPTVLPADLLVQALAACREAFDVAADAEITCEANPGPPAASKTGAVDQPRFALLRRMGVNRLSLGVQSFDDDELRWLGRIHTSSEATRAFTAARAAGFANLNLDLIFGLPGQPPTTWRRTLAHAVSLQGEHLSLYGLTLEEGAPLTDRVRRGLTPAPDDDLAADLYLFAADFLATHGYVQYEISNWARPVQTTSATPNSPASDRRCRHNLTYWRREPYLGFGAGAHSFETAPEAAGADRRWWNVRAVPDYIQRMNTTGSAEAGQETIGGRLAMGELMMLGLRLTVEGVSDARFREQCGAEVAEVFEREIRRLAGRGLLERLPDRVRLTPNGRLLGNRVFAQFLP